MSQSFEPDGSSTAGADPQTLDRFHQTAHGRTPRPDNATLLALLAEWAPDPTVMRKILVDNPAFLYGFE